MDKTVELQDQLRRKEVECNTYKQALDEIEDLVKNHIMNDITCWDLGTDIVEDYVKANCRQILEQIQKVKENEQ